MRSNKKWNGPMLLTYTATRFSRCSLLHTYSNSFSCLCSSTTTGFLSSLATRSIFVQLYGTSMVHSWGSMVRAERLVLCFITTHVSLLALPFLAHTELFLYPILIGTILYVASLFGFNVSQNILTLYFGTT